jgi:hypothetical protein
VLDPWTRGVTQEDDAENRTQLKQLLDRIDANGSIIVPMIDDVLEPRNQSAIDVVDRILTEKIPVICMQNKHYRLTQFLDHNPVDASVFEQTVQNSLKVRSRLERFVLNRFQILKAANEFAGRPI